MLRIMQHPIDETTTLFKLEGKLLEPWIEEIMRLMNGSMRHVQLDLSDLSYADRPGVKVLASLLRQGATLTACNGLIAAFLEMEKS